MRSTNEKGFTLVEATVVLAILGLLLGPVLTLLTQGYSFRAQAGGQSQVQNEANRILSGICEGDPGAGWPGLLAAQGVAISPTGLAFLSGGRVITYYYSDAALYRKTAPYAGSLSVDPTGGEEILSDVKGFAVSRSGSLYSLRLEMAHVNPDGTTNRITLQTAVRPRNLNP